MTDSTNLISNEKAMSLLCIKTKSGMSKLTKKEGLNAVRKWKEVFYYKDEIKKLKSCREANPHKKSASKSALKKLIALNRFKTEKLLSLQVTNGTLNFTNQALKISQTIDVSAQNQAAQQNLTQNSAHDAQISQQNNYATAQQNAAQQTAQIAQPHATASVSHNDDTAPQNVTPQQTTNQIATKINQSVIELSKIFENLGLFLGIDTPLLKAYIKDAYFLDEIRSNLSDGISNDGEKLNANFDAYLRLAELQIKREKALGIGAGNRKGVEVNPVLQTDEMDKLITDN